MERIKEQVFYKTIDIDEIPTQVIDYTMRYTYDVTIIPGEEGHEPQEIETLIKWEKIDDNGLWLITPQNGCISVTLVEPSQKYRDEYPEEFVILSLAEVKEQKRSELKKACNEEIRAGFYSTAIDGESHLFGYNNTVEDPDQQNWADTLNAINAGLFTDVAPAKWKGGDIQWISIAIFKQLMGDALTHKLTKTAKLSQIEALLDATTTKEEIEAILWN